jgi:hypothetical protein
MNVNRLAGVEHPIDPAGREDSDRHAPIRRCAHRPDNRVAGLFQHGECLDHEPKMPHCAPWA